MALQITEIAGSEEGFDALDAANATKVYRVRDPDDRNFGTSATSISAMRAAVLAHAPAVIDTNLNLDRLSREFDEEGRAWIWSLDYNWKPPESTLVWGFDTQGGSVNVQFAATTRYGVGAPDYQGGIGWNGSGFDGVEKVVPALKLNARYRWQAGAVTTSYVNTLAALTGTTNAAPFHGYAIGELLFLGASGEIIPGKPTEITYQFAASSNAALTIGSIANIAKQGHEYLWISWEDTESENRLVKRPLGAYVAKIYSESSFLSLGLGA